MNRIFNIMVLMVLCSCGKEYNETDPSTGQVVDNLTNNSSSTCTISGIKQIDGSSVFNSVIYSRDTSGLPLTLNFSDSTTKTMIQSVKFTYKSDTVFISDNEWLLIDKTNKNVLKYYKRIYTSATEYDEELYEYKYDNLNHLVSKSTYFNNPPVADYITTYSYSADNNLIGCSLKSGIGQLLLQSTLKYDLLKKIKPWIYLYADSFENYIYLLGFNFGTKPANPINEMVSIIYDVQTNVALETWKTTYSGYVYSKDNYVLQVTCTGDVQQGLGLYLGTMRFDYSCK